MTSKPTAWVEVIDPVTGLKVDITVSFHGNWHLVASAENDTAAHVNRIAGIVIEKLTQPDGRTSFPFDLSDYEGAE